MRTTLDDSQQSDLSDDTNELSVSATGGINRGRLVSDTSLSLDPHGDFESVPTSLHAAPVGGDVDPASLTDARVQVNMFREYEQRFADLRERAKLTKLCSNAGLAKTIEKRQFFMTLDGDQLDRLNGSCREYTLPRSDQSSQVKGWISGNTKIGPVLDVMVCYHQGRYGVENKIESLFRDKTCSWVRIVNGINTYVTETSEESPVASV